MTELEGSKPHPHTLVALAPSQHIHNEQVHSRHVAFAAFQCVEAFIVRTKERDNCTSVHVKFWQLCLEHCLFCTCLLRFSFIRVRLVSVQSQYFNLLYFYFVLILHFLLKALYIFKSFSGSCGPDNSSRAPSTQKPLLLFMTFFPRTKEQTNKRFVYFRTFQKLNFNSGKKAETVILF